MKDLIDRQELLDALHERLRNPKKPEQSAGIAAAEKIAQRIPAVEPKRGEWFGGEEMYSCSYCWKQEYIASDYCPNCGAVMRGEECGTDT